MAGIEHTKDRTEIGRVPTTGRACRVGPGWPRHEPIGPGPPRAKVALASAAREQAAEGDGDPEGVRVTRVGRGEPGDLLDAAQPVADGVRVDEQRPRRTP